MSDERISIANPEDFGKVAVLLGGDSAEREISLLSGAAVYQALLNKGVDAHQVDASGGLQDKLDGFDRVWIALHGRGGEDGVTQGLLESLGLPYTGSGVLGSALCMDKLRTKKVLQASGIETPAYAIARESSDCAGLEASLGLPMMLKPALEGSSIGMSRVDRVEQILPAFEKAIESGCDVLAEAWVSGPEYTASILQGEVLPLILIETDAVFFDYAAKYQSNDTRYISPCGLSAEKEYEYQVMAAKAFAAVGASGWGRVDFMLNQQGEALVLEVNTVPGMTSHSLVPMAAKQAGIDFDMLVWRILETSWVAEDSQELTNGC
ncbi:MAG: D-alanine--D-alanine ligase [Gammaproteobacteria bacterium]|nr:D-alanine--D-alanine ligase [Gammaproteobacteria bacterium]